MCLQIDIVNLLTFGLCMFFCVYSYAVLVLLCSIFIRNLLLFSDQVTGDEVNSAECLNKKGKNLGSDSLVSASQRMTGLVKNGSKRDLLPSTSENDAGQPKTRTPTGRSRQTQSGPLVAGAVLNHSMSERMRNLERFVIIQ